MKEIWASEQSRETLQSERHWACVTGASVCPLYLKLQLRLLVYFVVCFDLIFVISSVALLFLGAYLGKDI